MNNDTLYNILFCGIGGQGVLKASEICGLAALANGYHVKKSEVHGMAQRGGSVESHLRFGDAVRSPLVIPGQADFLVCFHADEADRLSHFLRPEGVSFRHFLDEFSSSGIDRRFLNTWFLGILSAHLPMTQESWLEALAAAFKREQVRNREVFLDGARVGSARTPA